MPSNPHSIRRIDSRCLNLYKQLPFFRHWLREILQLRQLAILVKNQGFMCCHVEYYTFYLEQSYYLQQNDQKIRIQAIRKSQKNCIVLINYGIITRAQSMLLILSISDGPNQAPGQQHQADQANWVQALVIRVHTEEVRRDKREHGQHGQNTRILSHVEGRCEEYLHHAHHQARHRTANQELTERNGISHHNWIKQRHHQSEHHTRVITDLQARHSNDLLLNHQAIGPQQTCQDIKRTKEHSQSYISHKVILELRMSGKGRIYFRHYKLSVDSHNNSETACQNARDLHRMNLSAVQPIIAQKCEDRPADVENIDNRQRNNEVHKGVCNLINDHNSISYQQVFIIFRSLEVQIDAQEASYKVMRNEDGDSSHHVGLNSVILPLREIDEAKRIAEC